MILVTSSVSNAEAHSTPFSYVDVHVDARVLQLDITAHVVDVSHDLGIAVPESLLEQALPPSVSGWGAVLQRRLRLSIDREPVDCGEAGRVDVLKGMQSIRWTYTCRPANGRGAATAIGPLFPYDAQHHTFVNVYLDGVLRAQSDITGPPRVTTLQLQPSSRWDTMTRFTLSGVHHILGGPDHLLFLVGLLLIGGSLRRLVTIVTAFTISHSITLAAAVFDILSPSPSVIEPLIALSIVAVGIGNLRHGGGPDRRALAAGGFGLIHGFGFASVLREMQLARSDLLWSLLSFNIGVELGQMAVVIGLAWLFSEIRQLGPTPARRLVTWGSSMVVVAGTFWFVARVAAAL